MTPDALDRLGADGFCAERMTFYAALYPRLREVARQHGYALPLHGSLTKDLDLAAIPWTEAAAEPVDLVKALAEAANGFVLGAPVERPHGRRAVVIHLGSTGGYLDLSILPRSMPGTLGAVLADLQAEARSLLEYMEVAEPLSRHLPLLIESAKTVLAHAKRALRLARREDA